MTNIPSQPPTTITAISATWFWLQSHRRLSLAIGLLLGLLAATCYMWLLPKWYLSDALLYFPPISGGTFGEIIQSAENVDLPSLPVLDGVRIIPLPGTSASRAALILESHELRRTLALQHPEWTKVWGYRDGTSNKPSEQTIERLLRKARITVGDIGDLRVGFIDHDPRIAQQVAVALVSELSAFSYELRANRTAEAEAFLKDVTAEAESREATARKQLTDYESTHSIASSDEQAAAVATMYADRKSAAVVADHQADAAEQIAQKALGMAWDQIHNDIEPASVHGGQLAALYWQVAELNSQLAILRTNFTDEYPAVKDTVAQLQEAQGRLKVEVTRQSQLLSSTGNNGLPANEALSALAVKAVVARAQATGLDKNLAEAESTLRALPSQLLAVTQSQIALDLASSEVSAYKKEEASVQAEHEATAPVYSVLDSPVVPATPDGVPPWAWVLILTGSGILLGSIPAYLKWLQTPPATEQEAEKGQMWYGIVRVVMLVLLLVLLLGVGFIRAMSLPDPFEPIIHIISGLLIYASQYTVVPFFLLGISLRIKYLPPRPSRKLQLVSLWPFLVLVVYVMVNLIRSSSPMIAEVRSSFFLQMVFPFILAAVFFANSEEWHQIRNLIFYVGCGTILTILLSGNLLNVLLPQTAMLAFQNSRLVIESDTITTSMNLLLSALAGITILLTGKLERWKIILLLLFSILLLLAALMTGSRGPLLSFAIAICLLIALTNSSSALKLTIISLLIFIGLSGFLLLSLLGSGASLHLQKAANDVARENYRNAVLASPPTLLGHGVGSFSKYYFGNDAAEYIHNAFLEAYFEHGIIGLVLFASITIGAWVVLLCAFLRRRSVVLLFPLLAFTFFFIEAQFSGNLLSNRGWIGFCLICYLLAAEQQTILTCDRIQ